MLRAFNQWVTSDLKFYIVIPPLRERRDTLTPLLILKEGPGVVEKSDALRTTEQLSKEYLCCIRTKQFFTAIRFSGLKSRLKNPR